MGIKIHVHDNESIDIALARLRQKELYEYKRWTKKRYGYYEKPSVLKRKRKKMARLWSKGHPESHSMNTLHLYIGLKALFARTGPNNAAGH